MNDQLQRNGGGEGDLEALAAEAHDVEQKLIDGFNMETVTRWHIAKWLDRFLGERMYERPGIDCESENEWFGQPYVPWSRGYARGVLSVYRALVKARNIDPKELTGVDLRNLQEGLPLLADGRVTAKRLISDAKALSRSDMRIHYAEGPDAPLDAEREPERKPCPTCGSYVEASKIKAAA